MARSKGDGSVYKLPDGRWRGYVTAGYRPDGKRDRRYVTARTKTEVLRKLEQLKGQALTGTLPEPGRMTLGQYLDRWLEHGKRTCCMQQEAVTKLEAALSGRRKTKGPGV